MITPLNNYHFCNNQALWKTIEAFELMSAQVPRLTEPQYLGYFMGGLRPDIRQRVRLFHPENRACAMQVARDMERELEGVSQPTEISAFRARVNQPGLCRFLGSGVTHKLAEPISTLSGPRKPNVDASSGTTSQASHRATSSSPSLAKSPTSSNWSGATRK